MKKNKIISTIFCLSMLFGNVIPVLATQELTIDTLDQKQETEVLYNKSATYFVTIPKTIVLDDNKTSNYSVKVSGDISSDKEVYVSPIDQILQTNNFDFYMQDQSLSNPKDPVIAVVTQNKFYWNFQDVANSVETIDNMVNAIDLTSGNWKGIFNFQINLKDVHSLEVSEPEVKIGTSMQYQVNAYLDGEEVNDIVNWSSDNENIVVTDGLIETKASAKVGDVATVTVSTDFNNSISLFDNSRTNNRILSTQFTVKVIDIAFTTVDTNELITTLEIIPGESRTVEATIIPGSIKENMLWSTTTIAGINLIPNENTVIIKVSDDMLIGSTHNIIATYGKFSKILNVEIISEDRYKISTIAKENGIISNSKTLNSGESYTVNITPISNLYAIEDVLVDGISVGAVNSYTFENVTEDHTISASFKRVYDNLSIVYSQADTVSQTVEYCSATNVANVASLGANARYNSGKGTQTITTKTETHSWNTDSHGTVIAQQNNNNLGDVLGKTIVNNAGESILITISPEQYYYVKDITYDGVSILNKANVSYTDELDIYTIKISTENILTDVTNHNLNIIFSPEWKYIKVNSNVLLCDYLGTNPTIDIPATWNYNGTIYECAMPASSSLSGAGPISIKQHVTKIIFPSTNFKMHTNSFQYLFHNDINLKTIVNLPNYSGINSYAGAFQNCYALINVDGIRTDALDYGYMFNECHNLTTINGSNTFRMEPSNSSNIVLIDRAFANCYNLNLNLYYGGKMNVNACQYGFYNCNNINFYYKSANCTTSVLNTLKSNLGSTTFNMSTY